MGLVGRWSYGTWDPEEVGILAKPSPQEKALSWTWHSGMSRERRAGTAEGPSRSGQAAGPLLSRRRSQGNRSGTWGILCPWKDPMGLGLWESFLGLGGSETCPGGYVKGSFCPQLRSSQVQVPEQSVLALPGHFAPCSSQPVHLAGLPDGDGQVPAPAPSAGGLPFCVLPRSG